MIRNIEINGIHGKPILTDLFYRKNNKKKPLVIFCHGYKGFKDWGAWNQAAKIFMSKDLFFVKFNFAFNGGTVENPIDFPDLNAFGENNFIKELDDIESVISWVKSQPELNSEIDLTDITLIGHSRGGAIALLKASENHNISKIITWAAVSDFEPRFPKGEILDHWKKEGVVYITNSRTKQEMPHFYQFYTTFIENKERLNIKRAVESLKIPQLIVHGDEDETVGFKEAENIQSWNPDSKLIKIENCNHTFNVAHPFSDKELPKEFITTIHQSIQFIIEN